MISNPKKDPHPQSSLIHWIVVYFTFDLFRNEALITCHSATVVDGVEVKQKQMCVDSFLTLNYVLLVLIPGSNQTAWALLMLNLTDEVCLAFKTLVTLDCMQYNAVRTKV